MQLQLDLEVRPCRSMPDVVAAVADLRGDTMGHTSAVALQNLSRAISCLTVHFLSYLQHFPVTLAGIVASVLDASALPGHYGMSSASVPVIGKRWLDQMKPYGVISALPGHSGPV
jgi:hypothetical protein